MLPDSSPQPRRRFLACLALAAVPLLALSGCDNNKTTTPGDASKPAAGGGAPAAAATGDPVRVGVVGPYSGGSSPMGLSMRDGLRLAAEEINNAGGVLGGRKVELVERDDQSNNERGAQVMQDMINSQKCVAILGSINTGVAQASYRYPQAAKVPYIINVATGAAVNEHFKEFPDNYVFGVRANDTLQSEFIAAEAIDRRGFKKVAIMADDTNYGQNGRDLLEKALGRRGVTAVSVSKFKIKDTDMTPQVQEARAAGAEAVLTYGIGPELAQIANSMEKLGFKVPLIGSWTLSMSNFIDAAGPNGNGAMMPQTFIQGRPMTNRGKSFVEAYKKKYGADRIPSPVSAAQGYDSMYLLAQAINQANGTEGPKLKAALEDLQKSIEGAVTVYDKPFSGSNHEAIKAEVITPGQVKDGRVEVAAAK